MASECYVEYSRNLASGLGPLSRRLIAVDLLTREELPSTSVYAALPLEDVKRQGLLIRRMFGCRVKPEHDKPLKRAARFKVKDPTASNKTDRSFAQVCCSRPASSKASPPMKPLHAIHSMRSARRAPISRSGKKSSAGKSSGWRRGSSCG